MSDRPEIMHEPRGAQDFGVVEKELTVFERLFNMVWLRKCILLVLIAVIWEVYGRHLDNQLLVPTFSDTVTALWGGIKSGVLLDRSWTSVKVLLNGRERQNYPLADMILPPARIVSLLSREMTLLPGDVIACGTSVGALPMRPGMVVEVAIEGIGHLRNHYLTVDAQAS